MFQSFYTEQYRMISGSQPDPVDGLGDEAVQTRLAERGLTIPKALFDYYSLFGYHGIHRGQNHLRTIEELERHDDWLIFMDEDHGMVCWGIHKHDLSAPDPVVWQGVLGEEIDWLRADSTLSRFLIEKWKETI